MKQRSAALCVSVQRRLWQSLHDVAFRLVRPFEKRREEGGFLGRHIRELPKPTRPLIKVSVEEDLTICAPRTDARNERQLVLKTNRTSAMSNQLVITDPEILGGTPVFAGTRVPLAVLFENLADGLSLDEILESYPTLKRAQVIEALHQAESLLELAKAA